MNFEKHIVLVGGYPGSGKTSFATLFESMGYFLVDDPNNVILLKDMVKDKDKVVITCPYLTIEKNMNKACDMFRNKGYVVSCIQMVETKEECLKRAGERTDEKCKVKGLINSLYN